MVAGESSASNAMHSGMDRRGGMGAWITDRGSLPLSITTSAPARTGASSPAKSLAASASGYQNDGEGSRPPPALPLI